MGTTATLTKAQLDKLYTARWNVKKKLIEQPEDKNLLEAYDTLTSLIESSGSVPKIDKQEPPKIPKIDLDPKVDPSAPVVKEEPATEVAIADPVFVKLKGIRFKESSYLTPSKTFEGLVVHYTVSGRSAKSAEGVASYLAKKGYGCMTMDENGIIYIPEDFDVLRDAAAHAGASKWGGRNGLNRYFAGMEICGWGRSDKKDEKYGRTKYNDDPKFGPKGYYQPFTAKQEQALLNFIAWAKKKNPAFKIANIAGHHEVSPGRKQDPGASLSFTMDELREKAKHV